MKQKFTILILTMIISTLLTGCWDKTEINNRGFVIGLGIDKLKEEEKKEELDKIKVSFKIPNVAILGTKQTPTEEPSFYWEAKGESFDTVINKIQSKSPFDLELSHNKVIILGKEILEDKKLFKQILDGIDRNRYFSRKMFMLVSKEDASDVIGIRPDEQPLVGVYYGNIINSAISNGTVIDGTLNKVMQEIQENKSTVFPLTTKTYNNKRIELIGGLIVKDYEFKEELNELECRFLNMINQDNYNIMDIHVKYKNVPVSYEITSSKSEIKVTEKDNNLILDVYIDTEGDITQHEFGVKGLVANDKGIREVEKLCEENIKEHVRKLITKLQKGSLDVIDVKNTLYKYNQPLYKKVSEDFDQYFENMKVNVHVESKIRRIGIVR
ncbi:Ger(x)C family spore germination protein [Tepidibacter hydrothermalis]|uniref:Ger(X)C family spore germination protein n=1 Tax=Tepidibacter hydrothermalis TaxID=3036126 RepID=A0ABY8EEB2_9FIRM|nr:Ger(x)C family spore germination protein [Tepidibacter hydrothermalis]WFD10124.1 Ger(x)C family spore germination protein [Tepidibacter hydrothermalis]